MIAGAIYLLSRQVQGDHGESFMQNVTVFASSAAQARSLVEREFAALRTSNGTRERAYQAQPEFSVERVSLDGHKMITAGITTY
jgi:hypothetical protein